MTYMQVFQTDTYFLMRMRFFKHTHWLKTTHAFHKYRRMRLVFGAIVIFKPTETSHFTSFCYFFWRICLFFTRKLGYVCGYSSQKHTHCLKTIRIFMIECHMRVFLYGYVVHKLTQTCHIVIMCSFQWRIRVYLNDIAEIFSRLCVFFWRMPIYTNVCDESKVHIRGMNSDGVIQLCVCVGFNTHAL